MPKRILIVLSISLSTLLMLIAFSMTGFIQLSPLTLSASIVLLPITTGWLTWIASIGFSERLPHQQFLSRQEFSGRIFKALFAAIGIGIVGVLPFTSIAPVFGLFVWLPICVLAAIPLAIMGSVHRAGVS